MQEVIFGGGSILAAFAAGLWRLHRHQILTESRITNLEAENKMLNKNIEAIESSHQSLADKVTALTGTVHQIDKNVTTIATQIGYLVEMLKNR